MLEQLLQDYKKGTFITLQTRRPAKVKKSCSLEIEKVTTYVNARLGIAYDNISQTIQKREEGEIPEENAGLKWGEWENYPYTISHNGNRYLRIYADRDLIEVKWLLDGEVINKSDIEEHLLSSEKSTSIPDKYLTLTIKENTLI